MQILIDLEHGICDPNLKPLKIWAWNGPYTNTSFIDLFNGGRWLAETGHMAHNNRHFNWGQLGRVDVDLKLSK